MDRRTKLFKEAKILAIIKWTYIVNNNGSERGLLEAHPELKHLNGYCGFCELIIEKYHGKCKKCVLYKKDIGKCGSGDNHPYTIWHYNNTTKAAQAVLDLILNT